ncbi:MAG: glutamate dehydrogenase, partial [Candidatus Cryptobacteroides sp.]
KGVNWGGSLLRPEATGYGVCYFAQQMLATRGKSFEGMTVAISGAGNVAQFAAKKAMELGAKVVSMSDSNGTIYDAEGLDAEKLEYVFELKNFRRGRIREYAQKYPRSVYLDGQRPWNIPCDIALPCATQNEIEAEDARNLVKNGCFCVVEGANMPSTPEAIAIFQENRLLYSPGKASNAGGVATSGLEMTQNSIRQKWTSEEVDEQLHRIMSDIHEACLRYGTEEDGYINYVKGANIAGFIKVANAMVAQGLV